MREAILAIDMQNDFIDGSLGTKEAVEIVPEVKGVIETGRKNGAKIIFTRDTHFDDYLNTFEGKHLPVKHCIKNSEGWKITSELDTRDSLIIDKITFGYTEWKELLKEYDVVTIVGLCTDICVVSQALIIRAFFPEKEIRVIKNATAGVTPELKEAALKTMASCQITIE